MPLTVLTVAYPLAPIGPNVSGGAEQIASSLDRALVARGHRSIVVASADSEVAGVHVPTATVGEALTRAVQRAAQARHRAVVTRAIDRYGVDVVHLHGVDFEQYLPAEPIPCVVTLHLPGGWYSPEGRRFAAPHVRLVCVSQAQQRAFGRHDVQVIENGVDVRSFGLRRQHRFVLALGRVCGEKGLHFAVDAAERARVPILIGGQLFAYPDHQQYYHHTLAPRLARGHARFLGPVGFDRKRRLLGAARAVLIPSIAPETSSLVAMEAMASGTPVIAFKRGALPDLVVHGVTGFVVDTVAEMSDAIDGCVALDRAAIRRHAVERFAIDRMHEQYLDLYAALARSSRDRAAGVLTHAV